MMQRPFGAAFERLDKEMQRSYFKRMGHRRIIYKSALAGGRRPVVAILVGDRPGNGGRKLPPNHHHTPFYSSKNCSLWLNLLLIEAGIPETSLFWVNAYNLEGEPTHPSHVYHWKDNPPILALGGNAEKWVNQHTDPMYRGPCEKFFHPQAWKRFHSKEPYPLIERLKELTLDLRTPE